MRPLRLRPILAAVLLLSVAAGPSTQPAKPDPLAQIAAWQKLAAADNKALAKRAEAAEKQTAALNAAVRDLRFRSHLFDATTHVGKLAAALAGLRPVYVAYGDELGGKDYSPETARSVARKAVAAGHTHLVLDIEVPESDPRNGEEAADKVLAAFGALLDAANAEGIAVGMYGVYPAPGYYEVCEYVLAERARAAGPGQGGYYVENYDAFKTRFDKWQKASEFVRARLTPHCDFIAPSIYAVDDNVEGWRAFAEGVLAEAAKAGKPEYPFVWATYDTLDPRLAGKDLSHAHWKAVLQTCRENASGAVIWGGYQRTWDGKAPWVRSVKVLAAEKN